MTPRDKILNRLRNARMAAAKSDLATPEDRQIYADFPGATQQALLQQFAERFLSLKGEFFVAASAAEAADKLKALLDSATAQKILVQPDAFIESILAEDAALKKRVTLAPRLDLDSRDFAKYEVGISRADFLVARTGSIMLRSTRAGGRRLSVLPPFHIVVAEASRLVPSLDAAFSAFKKDGQGWSYAAVITGPSRTADIEKILVLGAHGPRRLAVILLQP